MFTVSSKRGSYYLLKASGSCWQVLRDGFDGMERCLKPPGSCYDSRRFQERFLLTSGERHVSNRSEPQAKKDVFAAEFKKPFEKILVANRGEIACRVMRTARRLKMRTVAVYSEPDADSPHVRMADEAVCVGPAASVQSYLNMDAILGAVKSTGAQAVHPGYGFLSENSRFVELLEEAGVAFVGPTSSAIAAMGDKIESKQLAMDAGVNTIPGCQDVLLDEDHAARIAHDVGFPVMLKATAGGGGKGMRIAWNEEEARDCFRLCRDEAQSSFGDGRIFIERFIEQPRHIEIQVLGDAHGNVVYLPERECSIQRRNQKVIEEAPSVFLDEQTRRAMGEQAVALSQAVKYQSAGTVEFLVDKRRNFYFLEMNTRLQVEHPVTECVTGIDLVEEMFRVAAGERLRVSQERAASISGWAMECRVYAEDPHRGFLPSNGKLRWYSEPQAHLAEELVRVDSGVEEGSDISIYYDPLISKLTTWAPDRTAAIASMERALDSYVIRGLTHNAPFLRSVVSHPEFAAGHLSTKFLQEHWPQGWDGAVLSPRQRDEMLAVASLLHLGRLRSALSSAVGPLNAKTNTMAAKAPQKIDLVLTVDGTQHFPVTVTAAPIGNAVGPGITVDVDMGHTNIMVVEGLTHAGRPWVVNVLLEGKNATCQILKQLPRGFVLQYAGAQHEVLVQSKLQASLARHMPPPRVVDYSKVLRSPMPGSLISVAVKAGQAVSPGDELAVVEAMKMRNVLRAERPAVVKAVPAQPGTTVAVDQVIIEFE